MIHYSKLIKQIFFFGLVGGTSLLIDLVVTTILFDSYNFPAYLAGIIGFSSAFFFNFPVNRKHVFKHTDNDRFSLRMQIILYISLSIFNLIMTGILMQIIVAPGFLSISFAKMFVTGVIAVWNFIIFKMFVFSKKNHVKPNGLDDRTLGSIL